MKKKRNFAFKKKKGKEKGKTRPPKEKQYVVERALNTVAIPGVEASDSSNKFPREA